MSEPLPAATYDRLAPWYDLLALPEAPFRRRAVGLLAPQPGERALVVGSGAGQELAAVAGARAHGIGIDLAPAMCRRARARLARAGLQGRAAVLCADALRLPLAEACLDAALLVFTLELFDEQDMTAVLAQVARALRPGGRLAVACLSRRRLTPMARLYEWAHRRWPRALDCRPILAVPLLEAGGWRVIRVQESSLCGLPVDLALAARPERPGAGD